MGEAFAVVVAIDGFRADALGSYGDSQASTPFLDRLSAESTLYDFAYCLDPTLESFYSSAILGVHPCYRYAGCNASEAGSRTSRLLEVGRHYLVTDHPKLAELNAGRIPWTGTCSLEIASQPKGGQADYYFRAAAEWLNDRFGDSPAAPCLGWIHATLPKFGDSIDSRNQYDAIVTRLDAAIRRLFEELSFPTETSEPLFVVTAPRGYALGERGQLGCDPPLLHEELLHVPLVVYSGDTGDVPRRMPGLTSPIELGDLLVNWFERHSHVRPPPLTSEVGNGFSTANPALCPDWLFFSNSLGQRAVRTPGWYFIRESAPGESGTADDECASQQLFLKPDDRWEVNEVSNLRPKIVELLAAQLDELQRQSAAGEALSLSPLPRELLKGS